MTDLQAISLGIVIGFAIMGFVVLINVIVSLYNR